METNLTNEEIFHSEYTAFYDAVEILSQPAELQCEVMGYYNVAWELQEDISKGGRYLIENPAHIFSEDQILAIQELIDALDEIPSSILIATDEKEENIKAMKYTCWKPLRKMSKELLSTLKGRDIND